MSAVIKLAGIKKIYQFGEGSIAALDGIDLEIERGELLAIMGPSGSGKSTMMNIIGCLDAPTHGAYILEGQDVSNQRDEVLAGVRNRRIGFVFQTFNLMPRQTAIDNVELPLLYGRAQESKKKARIALERVGLGDRLHHTPAQLSGGQCQRVAIARAIATNPSIILADEPTGALDTKTGREIMELFCQLNSEGVTVIVVTHAPEVAEYCRCVVRLQDGKVIQVAENAEAASKYPPPVIDEKAHVKGLPGHGSAWGRVLLFWQMVKIALGSLVRNKLRSFLTMLGMIIGVASVIAMMALGEGTKLSISTMIRSMGSNLLVVVPWWSRSSTVRRTQSVRLTIADAMAIPEKVPSVVCTSPEAARGTQVKFYNKNYNTRVVGTWPTFQRIRCFQIGKGRFFNQQELNGNRNVCVLTAVPARELFGAGEPLGKTIKIQGFNFEVIGVCEEKNHWEDDQIFIPLTIFQRRVFRTRWIHQIDVEVVDESKMDEAETDIEDVLRRRHLLRKDQENDFRIFSQQEILEKVSAITKTFQFLLAGIAAVSLLVGGIGIMNIMLVSVAERTREIGTRKAIGARRRDIMNQFLVESVTVSLVGGAIGVMLGIAGCVIATRLFPFDLIFTYQAVLLAFAFSCAVGLFFGIYPGKRASGLNPIDALRYE